MVTAFLSQGGAVCAEQDGPRRTTVFHGDAVILGNPDGAALNIGAYRRWAWGEGSDPEPSSYIQGGVSLGLNPAYMQAAVHGEWMPARFAILRIQYDYYIYSGESGHLMSFPSADSPFGDDELDALSGQEESADGHRFMLKPTLRAKAGRLMIVNETHLAYFIINGRGPYFREGEYDTLIKKDGDLLVQNLTMLPYEAYRKGNGSALYAGPFYQVTHAREADITRQRTGAVAYWLPSDRLWRFDRPRVYTMLGYNLQDRNRDNEVFFILGGGVDIDM